MFTITDQRINGVQQSPSSPELRDPLQSRQAWQRDLKGVSTKLERHLNRYGYDRIETPLVQDAELFLTKAGDQIVNRLFTFERGGRELSLRPEFTAPAAHLYVMHYPNGGKIVRWQFHGAVFEDSAQSAEEFQRFTIGAELIGSGGYTADAEVIAMAARGLDDLYASQTTQITIGHIGLLRELLTHFGLDPRTSRFLLSHLSALHDSTQGIAALQSKLDELLGTGTEESPDAPLLDDSGAEVSTQYILDVLLDATQRGITMGGRTRHDIVRRLLQKRRRIAERPQIAAALTFLQAYSAINAPSAEAFTAIEQLIAPDHTEAQALLATWRSMIDLLSAYGIGAERIRIQPTLSRSWDYYTGMLFDLHDADGTILGGGGRYDELARLLGGSEDIPAVGFVYQADVIAAHIHETDDVRRWRLAYDTSAAFTTVIEWAQKLRQSGLAVEIVEKDQSASLILDSDSRIHWDGQAYLPEEIDVLVSTLKAASQ